MVVLMMVISIVKYLQAGIIILFNLQVEGVVRFGCGLPELMVKYQVLLSRVYRGYYEKNIYFFFLWGYFNFLCSVHIDG